MEQRRIQSGIETIPVIGLGTWQTFDAGNELFLALEEVLNAMLAEGGRVIDSSPMYGRSEQVVGELTGKTKRPDEFFYATKVWTRGRDEGIRQMNDSMRKMKRTTMDLMQIHNLVDWKLHLPVLQQWKEEGKIRYVGITHYVSSMHEELEKLIKKEKIDFVQFNYSIADRNAEKRLIQAAADHGVSTIVNRPFGEGGIFSHTKGQDLPSWAKDYHINSWAQFFLKFIVSHPGITCVIPATSDVQHMKDNAKAGEGPFPDEAAREKMAAYFYSL